MRAARRVIAIELNFSCPGAPAAISPDRSDRKRSVDVVLFAGMQQLAEILNGMADVVERVVTDTSGASAGGILTAVVRRPPRDVSVDDVTPARIFSRTNRCPDIHRERRSLIRRVRWLPGWVLIQRKLVSLRAMRNKAQPESTIITPRQKGTVIRCGAGRPTKIINESRISPPPAFHRLSIVVECDAQISSSALPNTTVATMLSSAGTSNIKRP